jgi:hypothetical protein
MQNERQSKKGQDESGKDCERMSLLTAAQVA